MKRRILSFALCLVLLSGILVGPAAAATNSFEKTDNIAQNMVNAALAQKGKKNADFSGMPKNNWCAYFIIWLSKNTGAGDADILPDKYSGYGTVGKLVDGALDLGKSTLTCFRQASYDYLVDKYGAKHKVMGDRKSFEPQPGDLIFFRWTNSTAKFASHVALVYKVTDSKVYYVDGNGSAEKGSGDFYTRSYVDTHSRDRSDSQIVAYLRPDYGNTAKAPAESGGFSVVSTTNCKYYVTIPANYKLQGYQTPTSTKKYRSIAAQKSSYRLVCTQKLDMSDGSIRYFFVDGSGYEVYFIYNSKMSVKTVHAYSQSWVDPTCTEQGFCVNTCTCGESYESDYSDAMGHSWDSGHVTREPTEDMEGIMTFTCTVCGETQTETIPVLEHTHEYTDTVTAPSCTAGGYTTHTCSCGDFYTGSYTEALGHVYVDGECNVCGEVDPSWDAIDKENKIIRLAGSHRYETAFLAADQLKVNLGIEKFDAVVVASGINFADALSGSYLAAVKNAPILLASGVDWVDALVKDYIKANLNPGGTVYILGGTGAVPAVFENSLDGFVINRLAGDNRFHTNLLVLEEAGVGDKPILVCTGLSFADSLSASAAKMPILLVWDNLTKDQEALLEGLNGNKLYIIGGESAVGKGMKEQLTAYGSVERVAGGNRFETSVAIAETFFDTPKSAVLAYAWNFPDGLCGGPLAVTMDAPLILTMDNYETKAAEYVQGNTIKNGIILGGENLISENTVNNIFN